MLQKQVENFIKKTANLRVALIGETIIDEFVSAVYEGYSMKSSCPVFRLEHEDKEVQQGGSAAIAGHLRNFVKEVHFITNTNYEIVKTRYIDYFDKKKHIEINKFDNRNFPELNVDTQDYDLTIVADFGHGFCNKLNINDGFHLMCQTNSNNFGFNRVSKWKNHRKKSICLDLREASLQMNRNITDNDNDIAELFNYELNSDGLYITIGSRGSVFTDGKNIIRNIAYPSKIVDTIGAGDTYFTFACLLSSIENRISDMTVPSLAASLSTTWLCNEKSVTKESLLEYANRFIQ